MYKTKMLLWFALCCLLISCSDPIENNSRIVFELKVIDDTNQPITDVEVSTSLFRRFATAIVFSVSSFEGILGVGATDAQGDVSLISLEPDQTADRIGVLINSNEQFAGDPINQDYGVVIYQLDSIVTKTTLLPDVILKRSAILEIEIIDSPDIESTLDYTITYPTRIQQFQFPSGEEAVSDSRTGSGIPGPMGILTFETLQNTTAMFAYTLTFSTGAVETNTVEIPINQEIVQYALEF